MYFIIYKYVLKPGRTIDQVTNWMRIHEATQAQWGETEADFYRLATAQTQRIFCPLQGKERRPLDRGFEKAGFQPTTSRTGGTGRFRED